MATANRAIKNWFPSCKADMGMVRSGPSGTTTSVSTLSLRRSSSRGRISQSYNCWAWGRYSRVVRFSSIRRKERTSAVSVEAGTGMGMRLTLQGG